MTREDANLNLENLEDQRGSGTYFRIRENDRVQIGEAYADIEYLKDVMFVLDLYFKSKVK
jgi:hypothetical protein